jgi:hypothetical protein
MKKIVKMKIEDRILESLKIHPEGVDDDELANMLNLPNRTQANMRCRSLEKRGIVTRRKVEGKIRTFLLDTFVKKTIPIKKQPLRKTTELDGWFWEGNVQSQIVRFLVSQGYTIQSVANTATHEQGVDIIASINGHQLWISVKGYPKGTEKTQPSTQAGHWFSSVIFDIIKYRGKDGQVGLAIGLPDFHRYHSLADKVAWLKPIAKFTYYWVSKSGDVTIQ